MGVRVSKRLSNEELQEYIEKGRTDWCLFINELLGMPLHDGQKKYIRMAQKAVQTSDEALIRRFVLTCANRWGKSSLIACIQLVYLFYKFGVRGAPEDVFAIEYRTANIAPTSKLTQPVFKAMKQIMTSSYPIRQTDGSTITNKCQIEWFYIEEKTTNTPPFKMFFINNSYIEHLSLMGNKGDQLQGLPYGIITYDEPARSDHLQIEIDDSILGRLLDWTAPLHLLSTPSQTSAGLIYYYDLYKEGLVGLNQSYTQEGSIYENEFMTPDQLEKHVEMLKDNPLKDQMLYGKFIFGTDTLFPGEDIVAAQDNDLNNGVRYEEGHNYVIGVDTAIGSDEMVYQVLDVTTKPYRRVWCEAVKGAARSPQMHLNALCNLVDTYRNGSNMRMIVETFNGESARFYEDLPPYIKSFTVTYGTWQPNKIRTDNDNPLQSRTAQIKKANILVALKKILADKQLKIPKNDNALIQQLYIYKEDDKKLQTDRLIALALAIWLAEEQSQAEVPVFITVEW